MRELAPLCASQFVKWGKKAVIQERNSLGGRQEFEHEVSVGVWQGSTLSSGTLRLTFWSRMADSSIEIHRDKLAAGFLFMC